MAKNMLIDATHPEETRVVVVSGSRLEEFDVEIASRKQLKGNIYLAKVVRVEPSLQAAFVEYGGNRHGFLAFNEIHPDYYRIPIADREALEAELAAEAEEAERRADERASGRRSGGGDEGGGDEGGDDRQSTDDRDPDQPEGEALQDEGSPAAIDGEPTDIDRDDAGEDAQPLANESWREPRLAGPLMNQDGDRANPDAAGDEIDAEATDPLPIDGELRGDDSAEGESDELPSDRIGAEAFGGEDANSGGENLSTQSDELPDAPPSGGIEDRAPAEPAPVETVGGEEASDDNEEQDEDEDRRRRPRLHRRYKIQEVIKRRQVMLIQVTKEERGNKGAALTTFLSLAGRYCVLMPNTARGGGVSRKITSPGDRKRLKSIIEDLEVPDGMAIIVRTAGMERSKPEIKRDADYLLRLWDEIREQTLKSTAPALIYEEANLIKRSIRDLYTRDIGDIIVEGEEAYRAAKQFMRTLTPSHAKRVQAYRDPTVPLFQRFQIENQLDAMHNPVVQLRSGGYIVINQTEALVSIDVNSGRATRERHIEDTALKTNIEAAEEIARQLRLRDLAGLIVIDFIDMEESRHNGQVERRLKEALKIDRARIQIGRISPFGLLEMSRQRLHPSLAEASTEVCRFCRGTGRMRSTESTALHVLRAIEQEGIRKRSPGITVAVPTSVALYILNQKRRALADIELRYGLRVYLAADDSLIPPEFRLDRLRELAPGEEVQQQLPQRLMALPEEIEDDIADDEAEAVDSVAGEASDAAAEPAAEEAEGVERAEGESAERRGDDERKGRRRRRRGRGRERGERGERREPRPEQPVAAAESEAIEPAVEAADDQPRAERPRPRLTPADFMHAGEVGFDDDSEESAVAAEPEIEGEPRPAPLPGAVGEDDQPRRRRRRGRRGGRRRRRGPREEGENQATAGSGEAESDIEGDAFEDDGTGSDEAPASEPVETPALPRTYIEPAPIAPEPMRPSTKPKAEEPIRGEGLPIPTPNAEVIVVDQVPPEQKPTKRGWWRR